MTAQDSYDCIQELLNNLWNSSDRFVNGDVQCLIEALEQFALPLIKKHIEETQGPV